ncbi:hypothetical protein DEO72_LG6g3215 [Vigna unguiculata]|uniref:Uncharacterized protein n=1 Tax=Vigna unguiculata TaxID=3917 RepID=A0A4D6MFB6_VIGUN|nr:hypothetical protein DEO72_LG6g3215 [Vigna unguiculata]
MTNHHQHLTYSGRPGTPATTPTTINDHLHRCITTPPRRLLTPETSPLFPAAQRLVLAHASTPTPKDRHLVISPPPATAVAGDTSVYHGRWRREPMRPSLSFPSCATRTASARTPGPLPLVLVLRSKL